MRIISSLVLLLICSVAVVSGCKSPGNPQQGMMIRTFDCNTETAGGPCAEGTKRPIPHIPISGVTDPADDYYDPQTGADLSQGTVTHFGFDVYGDADVNTGNSASVIIKNARTPAYWDMFVLWPFNPYDGYNGCGGANYTGGPIAYEGDTWFKYEFDHQLMQNYYQGGQMRDFVCTHSMIGMLPASTRFAVIGSFPGSLTLGSETPFTTTYGMPLLYVYDGTQTVVATQTATSVSSDGSQATFPFPATLAQKAYSLAVVNKTPTLAPAGTNYLTIASSTSITGNPFGVAVAAQSIVTVNCIYVMVGTPPHQWQATQCSQSSPNPNAVPVVSLYSANQVLIGSTHVNVGANPTAVVTYTANAITNTVNNSNGYTTTITSGSLRAIVANSGANTVTILDTVANVPVATVTVGSRPVALVVSSDGTAGYVANYADNTVTKINLSTNTPIATVAVGGQPTSVTLTAGGTLWAGGAGFLTEINASNMTVVGTETVPNRNIVALSYSNQLGQLIVQSTDSTAAVYEDEVNPAVFTAGGTYAALASHTVSTLGSYTVGSQHVRAFTSTLSSSSSLPINLPGAPPLVVQDGWAVVTATPTGFTITDASGHLVLVSQATSSPIAAIAVDPNLKMAYLTEPDSNTLLTVPLPGTGSN